MLALTIAIFTASLLGSLHCAGMCGAFVAFAVGTEQNRRLHALLHAAYNGGRLVTYCILGAIAGLLGSALDLGGSLIGLQHAAAIGAGSLMIGFGLIALARTSGIKLPNPPVPALLKNIVLKGHRTAVTKPPIIRALAVGMLTTLLPCGWLYAFAIVAAGTASPGNGALTMAVFWAGTLPVLVALGIGVQKLSGPLAKRIPTITALAIVAIGLMTVLGRINMPRIDAPSLAAQSSTEHLIEHVHSLSASGAPCCDDDN